MRKFFHPRKVPMSDGSILWEVVTPFGERVVSTEDEYRAHCLAADLNEALDVVVRMYPHDVVVNA